MAEGEGIRYSDLIMDDGALDRAIDKLKELRKYYADMVEDIKRQAKELSAAMSGTAVSPSGKGGMRRSAPNPATAAGQERLSAYQKEAIKLTTTIKDYNAAIEETEKLIKDYNIAQDETARLTRLIIQRNQTAEGSYNQLSKQYSINKIALNGMSDEMRRNTKEGQALERQTYEIYQQMIRLQEATGKHTLSVGNYGKALNGLNNATAQVVRELPALAISANTFFLAISNNIPILVDQINLLRQQNAAAAAQGKKGVSVIKAVANSFLSWNTVLTLVITAVTLFGDKIIDFIAGLFRTRDAALSASKALDNMRKSMDYESLGQQIADIQALAQRYRELGDSAEDKERFIKEYREELDATGIAVNDVKDAENLLIDNTDAYIDAIKQRAMAAAGVDLAAKKYEKALKKLDKADSLAEKNRQRLEKGDLQSNAWAADQVIRTQMRITALREKANAIMEVGNSYIELATDLEDTAKKTLEGHNLDPLQDDSGKGVEETAMRELEFVRQAEDERIALMEDGIEKELAQNRVKYQRQIEDLQRMLETEKNITAKGQEAIRQTMIYLSRRMYQEELSIRSEYYRKAVEEERQFRQELERAVKEGIESAVAAEVADSNSIDAMFSDLYRQFEETAETEYRQQLLSIERMKATEEEKTRLRLLAEKERLQNTLENNAKLDQLDERQVLSIQTQIAKIENRLSQSGTEDGRSEGGIFSLIFPNDKKAQKKAKAYTSAFSKAVDSIVSDLEYLVQKRQEAADRAVENADREVEAAQNALDQELEARNAGYANNVDTARRELALAKENQRKALAEQRRVSQEQVAIQSIQQASSLTSAIASLYASLAGLGPAGIAAATALSAVMFASFIASRAKAYQIAGDAGLETYGEGHVELLRGGSHQSGHDIDLGTKPDGTRRRAEGGEFFAVFNKRASRRYRDTIPDVVRSLNSGTFMQKYMNAYGGAQLVTVDGGADGRTMRRLSDDVRRIRRSGEETRYVSPDGYTVTVKGSTTRRTRKR